MAAIDKYKDLAQSLAIAKSKCDITGTGSDSMLTGMLEDSAGSLVDLSISYRPYFVAATFIAQSTDYQNLKKAGSVEFTGMTTAIESLYRYQYTLDQAFALIIPVGMEAWLMTETEDVPAYYSAFGSTSVRTTVS